MFPSVILSSAVRHLKVVDLPAPLIPSRIKHSSFLILKDIPLTASCSLKVFFREPTVICSLGNLPWRIYSTRLISVLTDESIELHSMFASSALTDFFNCMANESRGYTKILTLIAISSILQPEMLQGLVSGMLFST